MEIPRFSFSSPASANAAKSLIVNWSVIILWTSSGISKSFIHFFGTTGGRGSFFSLFTNFFAFAAEKICFVIANYERCREQWSLNKILLKYVYRNYSESKKTSFLRFCFPFHFSTASSFWCPQ